MAVSVFDEIASKVVTKTDKSKGAFVPTQDQRDLLSRAGYSPGAGGPNAVTLPMVHIDGANHATVDSSYYDSIRAEPGRLPETRIGRGLIGWVNQGDEVLFGRIGNKVYAWKAGGLPTAQTLGSQIAKTANRVDVLKKAKQATGKPRRADRTVSDFVRDPNVVAGALVRSNERCEMPGCSVQLFERPNGTPFLEVHHVEPLAEGGEDTLANAAALCPMCHREQHFGKRKFEVRKILRKEINQKSV